MHDDNRRLSLLVFGLFEWNLMTIMSKIIRCVLSSQTDDDDDDNNNDELIESRMGTWRLCEERASQPQVEGGHTSHHVSVCSVFTSSAHTREIYSLLLS